MADVEQIKVCPLCAETIKAAAKVCPHCRRSQRRIFFISQYDLQAFLALAIFTASIFLACWFFGNGKQFSPTRYKITVLNSQFGVEATSENTNVVMFGILTNASNYTWKLTGFQVRFLDASEKIVDLANAGSEYMDLVVLPHSDHSFKLSLYSIKTMPKNTGFKVIVTEAKDPGFWFNN
jgi:hypothetical protein